MIFTLDVESLNDSPSLPMLGTGYETVDPSLPRLGTSYITIEQSFLNETGF